MKNRQVLTEDGARNAHSWRSTRASRKLVQGGGIRRSIPLLATAAALLSSEGASALDPDRKISQYHHTKWMQTEGAPVPMYQVAQSAAGHLLLTSGEGFFRFDGWRFERIDTEIDADRNGPPIPLLVSKTGEAWTWYSKSGRFAIYRNGKVQFVPSPPREGEVTALVETPDGAIWAGLGETGRPLLHNSAGRWKRIVFRGEFGRDQLLSMIVAADGALWLSYIKSVLRVPAGSNKFQQVLGPPYTRGKLSLDGQGRVWVSETRGSRPISGPQGRGPWGSNDRFLPTEGGARRGEPFFDKDGSLWLARGRTGLERITRPHDRSAAEHQNALIEEFRMTDGLSADNTMSVFQDKEGTIWITTSLGLDRFRPASVVVEGDLKNPAAYGDVLFSASDGSVYIAQADTVYRAAPGRDPQPILTNTPEPEAICEGPDAAIWMVFADRIIVRRGASVRRYPKPPAGQEGVYDCLFDRQGTLWMSAAAGGLFSWHRDSWQSLSPSAVKPIHATTMVADKSNIIWASSKPSGLVRLSGRGPDRVSLVSKGAGDLSAINVSKKGLLFAAEWGAGEVTNGRVRFATSKQVAPLLQATGLLETPKGEIWAASRRGIVRVLRSDLEKAFADPSHVVTPRVLDILDGLKARYSNQSVRSMIQGGDGRIWVATAAGTVWVDPARLHSNSVPPPVAVTMVEAGGERHRDPVDIRLPAGTGHVAITFSVLSHSKPERAQVRYRLEGFDERWVDPGSRRQAFYTNLPPGDYSFQVIAANEDGVWNRTGTRVGVELPPTFFQSKLFAVLCGLAALGVLWLLYRARIRQVGRHIRERLEERIAERERIARELHDTLLQSVQGLILSFQAATEQLKPSDPTRAQLEGTLQRADDVLAEGRDRVHELRSTDESQAFEAAIATLIKATAFEPQVATQLVVSGERRSVRPIAAHELRAIVGEALRNIAQHAHARSVDVELSFAPKCLKLMVRDDGAGLPAGVQSAGSPAGHFGLTGMKERAAQIGGTLEIGSAPGAGTTIIVMVPAKTAYVATRSRLVETIRSRLWSYEAHA